MSVRALLVAVALMTLANLLLNLADCDERRARSASEERAETLRATIDSLTGDTLTLPHFAPSYDAGATPADRLEFLRKIGF